MKYGVIILLLSALSLGAASLPEFYVWQRSWTPAVHKAVAGCERPLSIFAAELAADRTCRGETPKSYWKKPEVTAVFRVRVEALNAEGFQRLHAEIVRTGCPRVELDIDVPVRRLGEYAELLGDLKKKLPPETRLSITALPSHLASPEFAGAAKLADFYILQLHGLEVPRNISDSYQLIDPAGAALAIRRARELKLPFKLALPSYAYQLFFNRESGAFVTLSAEGAVPPAGHYLSRLAAPDLDLLRNIIKNNPDLPKIWFRLPVTEDRFCYDRPTLEALERGELPAPRLDAGIRRVGNNAAELWLVPRHRLQLAPLKIRLEWKKPTGEFELAPGVTDGSATRVFAVLPTLLEIPFPGCGRPIRAATFFVNEDNYPVIKEIVP